MSIVDQHSGLSHYSWSIISFDYTSLNSQPNENATSHKIVFLSHTIFRHVLMQILGSNRENEVYSSHFVGDD